LVFIVLIYLAITILELPDPEIQPSSAEIDDDEVLATSKKRVHTSEPAGEERTVASTKTTDMNFGQVPLSCFASTNS
jgi:hypothetical protein